ncbi:TRAP transporter substrate-binding protein [Arthrobacter koreensis]|uniref:TRAP transporter substrate-binding protein n=1 Tax=Arthrobacter koreensis TaxID=199136 RepID=UPI0036D91DF6
MFTKTNISRPMRTVLAITATAGLGLSISACGGVVDNADAGEGESVTLTLATAAAIGTPNAAVQDWYLDRVEEKSDGRIKFDRTAPESLCKAAEVVDCIRDGRADLGVTVPDYTPQYFASVSVSGIPFIGQNSQAITQTLYEIHTDYEPAVKTLEDNGLHYISTWPVGRFLLGSKTPIDSADDLSGLQTRASGPVIQQMLTAAGANIAAITASETYEAAERGVVTSVGGAMDFAVNYKLMELLPYWTDPGIGQYSTFGMWFSEDVYEGLDQDLKDIIDEVTEELNAGAGVGAFNDVAAGQCDQLSTASSVQEVDQWDSEATDEWKKRIGNDAEAAWLKIAADYKLSNPQGLLDEYKAGLEAHSGAEYEDATSNCVANFTK